MQNFALEEVEQNNIKAMEPVRSGRCSVDGLREILLIVCIQ